MKLCVLRLLTYKNLFQVSQKESHEPLNKVSPMTYAQMM